jgi:superfamily II DNA helicase RecQ
MIVYCAARYVAQETFDMLVGCDILERSKIGLYVGTRGAEQYTTDDVVANLECHNSFVEGRVQVVVATNPFGCGIDIPCVRVVMHLGLPWSLLDYIQETGRAGRDNEPADCIMHFCIDDKNGARTFFHPGGRADVNLQQLAIAKTSCRRKLMHKLVDRYAISCLLENAAILCDNCEVVEAMPNPPYNWDGMINL